MTFTALRDRVLGFLAHFVLPLPEIEKVTTPWLGYDAGLITQIGDAAHVNTAAFSWRSMRNPFLAVALLDLLGVPISNVADIVQWIKQQQHPKGYFKKGALGIKASEATYHACIMLELLGADNADLQQGPLVDLLLAQQQPGQRQHFAFMAGDRRGYYAELEIALSNIVSLKTLGQSLPDPAAAIAYLQRKQTHSGEFKMQQPYRTEKGALDLISALCLLEANLKYPEAGTAQLQHWQVADGGFSWLFATHPDHYAGQPIASNLIDTSRTLISLYLLGAEPLDKATAIDRVLRLWEPEQGYFRQLPTDRYNYAYTLTVTYLGVLSLALLGAINLPASVDLRRSALLNVMGV